MTPAGPGLASVAGERKLFQIGSTTHWPRFGRTKTRSPRARRSFSSSTALAALDSGPMPAARVRAKCSWQINSPTLRETALNLPSEIIAMDRTFGGIWCIGNVCFKGKGLRSGSKPLKSARPSALDCDAPCAQGRHAGRFPAPLASEQALGVSLIQSCTCVCAIADRLRSVWPQAWHRRPLRHEQFHDRYQRRFCDPAFKAVHEVITRARDRESPWWSDVGGVLERSGHGVHDPLAVRARLTAGIGGVPHGKNSSCGAAVGDAGQSIKRPDANGARACPSRRRQLRWPPAPGAPSPLGLGSSVPWRFGSAP